MGVYEILGVSGQGLECLGSGVDGRLCDLRLCSENLGEEETLELESGRKEGPFAPQAARRATEGTVGDRRNFLGLDKQTRPFFGRAHGALTSLVSSEEAYAGPFSTAGLANFFLRSTRKETFRRKYCGHRVRRHCSPLL